MKSNPLFCLVTSIFLLFNVITIYAQDTFITTWRTTKPNDTIIIPVQVLSKYLYDYKVCWGDGYTAINCKGSVKHVYADAGTYQVSISGVFPAISFNNSDWQNCEKIISIDQWGSQQWLSMEGAFAGCTNLVGQANDVPDLSLVTSMRMMFYCAFNFNQDISNWDVSSVTDMTNMFCGRFLENGDVEMTSFNQDICNWDVSSVKDMSGMFAACKFDRDICNWDVSNVVSMTGMFQASSFNQDIGKWNISNVLYLRGAFNNTKLTTENFDKLLIGWSSIDLQPGVVFDAGLSSYCEGESARKSIINNFGWTIMDGGKDANCTTSAESITGRKSQLIIYPNPSSGTFYLSQDFPVGDISRITALNAYGNRLHVETFDDRQFHLEGDQGIYNLIIELKDGKSYIEKLILLR